MHKHERLTNLLDPLGLGAWQYHPVLGSTNDLALAWARAGAPDESLVLADAQTAGRGRGDRRWQTEPGCGLALSLFFRPTTEEKTCVSRFTALLALSLVKALEVYDLKAEVKWPNDILLVNKKVGGVLVETDWVGEELLGLVAGMGVNVKAGSVPKKPLRYPAISVEDALGRNIDRWALLVEILVEMRAIRSILTEEGFIDLWNAHLAFRNQWIWFISPEGTEERVKLLGVRGDGALELQEQDGENKTAITGEIVMAA